FQGQEHGSRRPFHYFADHSGDLAAAVRRGRSELLSRFPSLATPEMQAMLPDPGARATFEGCKVDAELDGGRGENPPILALHRDLLALRREPPICAAATTRVHGAVLGDRALVLRYLGEGGDRALVVNLGPEIELARVSEPLLASPTREAWRVVWS